MHDDMMLSKMAFCGCHYNHTIGYQHQRFFPLNLYFTKMLFLLIHIEMTECLCYQQQLQCPIDFNHRVAKIYTIKMENPNIS